MKILLTISSIDKNAGGTSIFIQQLANKLTNYLNVSILTLKSEKPLVINKNVQVISASKSFPKNLSYSKDMKYVLKTTECNIFHGNGLWELPIHFMAIAAKKRKIPYILSPHGMLEPWSLNKNKWTKRLALWFYQYNDLANAACIHATAQMEADNIRKLGFKNPIAIIPNGINLEDFPFLNHKSERPIRTVLFLSRVHPKKGIEILIETWSKLDVRLKNKWQLIIAGNGEEKYINLLSHLIKDKGLEQEIKIIGPQFGSAKLKAYQQADLFVLPTYSENFGIVVAEALACGIPVITTKGTPWEELNTRNAGWWIDIGTLPLTEALQQALQLTTEQRGKMGLNGRKLIEENYSIEVVTKKILAMYAFILYKTTRPQFIDHDFNAPKIQKKLILQLESKSLTSDIIIHHVISSIDLTSGGPSYSATILCSELIKIGFTCNITAISSNKPLIPYRTRNNIFLIENNLLKYLNLHDHLLNLFISGKMNIFHGHGIWQFFIHSMTVFAKKRRIPYIISPRGMLEPWALIEKKWKKRIALWLYQYNDIADAACIHATAQMEADNIRKLGFKNPIAIIPNGINLEEFPFPKQKPKKPLQTMLFLSRIHPKKGIEILIEAWSKLDIELKKNWQVIIAGNGEKKYINSLHQLMINKGLEKEIKIIGPQFGSDKFKVFEQADIFVFPTYSENFGIVVAEALACGVPVITTKGTPWEELNTHHAGWWIDIGISPLIESLQQALQLTTEQRRTMGQNGRQMIEENYTIEVVAKKMALLYEWVINGGEKPKFVDL